MKLVCETNEKPSDCSGVAADLATESDTAPKFPVITAFWAAALFTTLLFEISIRFTNVVSGSCTETSVNRFVHKKNKICGKLVRTRHANAQRGKHWQFCESHSSLRVHERNGSVLIHIAVDKFGGQPEVAKVTFWKRQNRTSDGILRCPMGAGGRN